MSPEILLPILVIASFLAGSIPFGYLATKAKGIDIRKVGSGNIGATNVNRALGTKWALVVFVLDVAKGVLPVLAARFWITEPLFGVPTDLWWFFAGAAALLGHMFSPWLGFKGGKGIATGLGMILGTAPVVAGLALLVFLLLVVPTRYISLASIVAVIALPLLGWFVPGQEPLLIPFYVALALFVVWKHRDNIARLRAGTESKFEFKKST